jgi:calnexin
LLEDFDPPVNPPKEIDDPEDFKPESWVDLAEIDDETAVKVGYSSLSPFSYWAS